MNAFSEAWLADYQAQRAQRTQHTQSMRPAEAAPVIVPETLYISLALSTPPSVNHAYSNVPGKGRVKTEAYRRWLRIAKSEAMISMAGKTKIMGEFRATIHVSCDGDIDNRIKVAMDFCKLIGAIQDDVLMTELHIYRQPGPPGIWIVLEKMLGDVVEACRTANIPIKGGITL